MQKYVVDSLTKPNIVDSLFMVFFLPLEDQICGFFKKKMEEMGSINF
jgi:hypothetical protein